jgi:hypothetical protein
MTRINTMVTVTRIGILIFTALEDGMGLAVIDGMEFDSVCEVVVADTMEIKVARDPVLADAEEVDGELSYAVNVGFPFEIALYDGSLEPSPA